MLAVVLLLASQTAAGAEPARPTTKGALVLPDIQTPAGASSALKWLVMITILSIAPAVVVMVTCFTRIIVVLGSDILE